MRRLGAHLSTSGGYYLAAENIVAIGGNALQIFSSSPRMWLAKLPGQETVERFKTTIKRLDIQPIFIHAKYLINLASDNPSLLAKSIDSLNYDLKVANLIGATGVIVHLGSHQGRGWKAIEAQVVKAIKSILKTNHGEAQLIIENSAGQQGKLCSQLSEIRLIFDAVNSTRLTWCLDTCHAFNAGYVIGFDSENHLHQNDIVSEIEKLKLLANLACIHLNDSRDEFASGHDRHANLGEGKLGKTGLSQYINHPIFQTVPLIIETPGFDGNGPDKANLDILKALINT